MAVATAKLLKLPAGIGGAVVIRTFVNGAHH